MYAFILSRYTSVDMLDIMEFEVLNRICNIDNKHISFKTSLSRIMPTPIYDDYVANGDTKNLKEILYSYLGRIKIIDSLMILEYNIKERFYPQIMKVYEQAEDMFMNTKSLQFDLDLEFKSKFKFTFSIIALIRHIVVSTYRYPYFEPNLYQFFQSIHFYIKKMTSLLDQVIISL